MPVTIVNTGTFNGSAGSAAAGLASAAAGDARSAVSATAGPAGASAAGNAPSASTGNSILQPPAGFSLFGAYPGSSADTTLAGYEGATLANRKLATFYRYYSLADSGTIPTDNDNALASAGRTLAICLTPSWAVPPAGGGVTYTSVTAGSLDSQIDALGARIAAMPGPVFVMYQAEMDLAARAGYGTAAQFIASHQRVTNRLRAAAPGMVVMAFVCCHTSASGPYYPGDAYVDWFGYDPYDTGIPPTSPSAIYAVYFSFIDSDPYAVAGGSGSGGAHGKPIVIAETGTVQGTLHSAQDTADAAWINAVPAALAAYTSPWGSQVQLWQWFNSSGGAGQTAIIPSSYSATAMALIGAASFFNP